jgi:hypothetical protein
MVAEMVKVSPLIFVRDVSHVSEVDNDCAALLDKV